MRVERLQVFLFSVPVDFRISSFRIAYSHQVLVSLIVDGVPGFGAAPLYQRKALKTGLDLFFRDGLKNLRRLEGDNCQDLRRRCGALLLPLNSALAFALDTALWDLEARAQGQPLWNLLGTRVRDPIPLTYQVFMGQDQETLHALEGARDRGFSAFKIKIGRQIEADLDLVTQIRERLGSEVEIKLDANRAFGLKDALNAGRRFRELGVALWEEPLAFDNWDDLRRLREETGIPIMLDESVPSRDALETALKSQALDLLNLKLTRCGGLSEALFLAHRCAENGIHVSVGCSEDLGPAMGCLLHLSAVLVNLVGTEGPGWERLGFDIGQPPLEVIKGAAPLPQGPGIGVEPDFEKLRTAGQEHRFKIWDLDQSPVHFLADGLISSLRQRVMNRMDRWKN